MARRFSHYLVLFGLFAIALVGFSVFSWDKNFQIALIIALAVSYVTWGIVHHFLHDDLYFEVVVEYVGIALLGSIIIISLLL
ncbi:hypothetical protein HYV21_02710 [Candidatus Microgenomates bacterium]|nr:hypothetical protein [Candidatus Microgenomates bacterium]